MEPKTDIYLIHNILILSLIKFITLQIVRTSRMVPVKCLKKYNIKLGQWSFCKNYKDLENIISILFLIQHNCIFSRHPTSEASKWRSQ